MTKDEWYAQLFERLGNSKFRNSFHLKQKGAIVQWTMLSTDRAGGETIRYLLHNTQPQPAVGSASVNGTSKRLFMPAYIMAIRRK
jgi:hypothetical protein